MADKEEMVHCPRCGGYGGEPGSNFGDYGWHACYACGETGRVSRSTLIQIKLNDARMAEMWAQDARERNCNGYDGD